jgi:hypothetical protein
MIILPDKFIQGCTDLIAPLHSQPGKIGEHGIHRRGGYHKTAVGIITVVIGFRVVIGIGVKEPP